MFEPDPGRKRSDHIIGFIERFCRVPEGARVGMPIQLADWQKQEIRNIYDNEHGTRRAILSFGRKNGKTTFAACLLLAHLVGRPAKANRNSQLYSAAQSRDQAALIFNLAVKMIRLNPDLQAAVIIRESSKELQCREFRVRYKALSADASTNFGLSPSFIIHDELGQVKGPRSSLYEALETAVGAQANPLSIIISTQAATDTDLLSILIDDAKRGFDPRTIVSLYAAPVEDNPFTRETIEKANPALGVFLSETEVLAMAQDAKRMPAREAEFRNLILNQRIETANPFIAPAVWKACGGPIDEAGLKHADVYAGLDLSEVQDLTAMVLMGRVGGKWHVKPIFWLPEEGLQERGIHDRQSYDQFAREGYLTTTPGKSVSYEHVAKLLRVLFNTYRIRRVAFDRWNMKHLKPWLYKAGFSEQFVETHFVEFGQGMQSMSPALRDLEQLLLDGELVHGNNPLLAWCVTNTTIVIDDAGNRKPSKRKSTGRIDGLVALAMAAGIVPDDPKVDVTAMIA
jgi:phage terminase large subunit-like protein